MPYLCGQQFLGYVDSTAVRPTATISRAATEEGTATEVANPAYVVWLQQDQMVLSAILSSLSEEVLAQVLFFATAKEIWDALESMFASSSRARTMQLRVQLTTFKKND